MTKSILTLALSISLAALTLACSGEGDKDPERTVGSGARLSESDIRAAISGKSMTVTIKLQRTVANSFSGKLAVDLVRLGEEKVVSSGAAPFTLDSNEKEVSVTLAAPTFATLGELGGYVLRYRIEYGDDALWGLRSLFMAASRTGLLVAGNNRFAAGEQGILRVGVNDPSTGKGLPGQQVSVSFSADSTSKDRVLAAGKTDKLGEFVAKFSFTTAEKGSGSITVLSGNHKSKHSVVVEMKRQILLTTDKPMYQPGQTVHIRALAMKQPRVTPVAGEQLLLEVEDSQGNKVFKQTPKTDSYGISSLRYKLARLVNLGQYTVRVTMGTTVRSKTFKVEKYVLPKFKVQVVPTSGVFKPGQPITGAVEARYFFSKFVKAGKVNLIARGPYSSKPLTEVNGTTDDKGRFSFSFSVPGNSYLPVTLLASVTDTTGAQAKGSASVLVSSQDELLQLVADRTSVVAGDQVNVFLMLTDMAGKPRSGSVDLSGLLNTTVKVPASGLAQVQVSIGACSGYQSNKIAAQTAGAYRTLYFSCGYGSKAKQALRVSTDKAIYSAGQTAKISLRGPTGAASVSLDVLRQNATVASHQVKLTGGKGTLSLKLTGDLSRTLVLRAHATAGAAVYSDQRMIHVQGADQLTIKLTTDKKQYRPSGQAKVTLSLTDAKGNPAPGALGVQVVDEALYALTEVKPGLERKFFFLEQAVVNAGKKVKFIDPTALLKANPTADDQLRASMLFAAAGQQTSFPINHNSALKDRAAAINASRAGLSKLGTALEQDYKDKWSGTDPWNLTEADRTARKLWLEHWLADRYDDFGVAYKSTVQSYSYGGISANIKSAGMDELWDSGDDLNNSVYLMHGGYPSYDAATAADGGGWYPDSGAAKGDAGAPPPTGDGGAAVKIRQEFPETLYVNPALITDNQGKATIDLALADSITSWRVTSIAHTMGGQLGSSVHGITVFQEFFVDTLLPTHLVQGDEVTLPVAVYNYTSSPQAVTVTVKTETWFDLLSASSQVVTVPAKSVSSALFSVRAKQVGTFGFTATGLSATDSDGIKRSVRVLPDGEKKEVVFSGELKAGKVGHTVTIPKTAIDGASELYVRVFPGLIAEAMTGLESLFRKPYGCFEQTSSTTYPNALVMQYLKGAGFSSPAVAKKALAYLADGYQRLLKYEVPGGGFSLWGKVPANPILTAFGLMEFSDMSKVTFVDGALITRTQAWLAAQQDASGAFIPPSKSYYEIPGGAARDAIRATAYVAWALHKSGYKGQALTKALSFVRAKIHSANDTYTEALAANAFLSYSPTDADGLKLLATLKAKATSSSTGMTAHWTSSGMSMTYGYGKSMTTETTALVLGALLLGKDHGALTGKALRWLVEAKGGYGGWGTTQATILAVRALLLSQAIKSKSPPSGSITISHNGAQQATSTVTPATADVTRLYDLKQALITGDNKVELSYVGSGELAYQVVGVYYLPHGATPTKGPLAFSVSYDKTSIKLNESIKVTAKVQNKSAKGAVPTVMMRIGLPPGFTADTTDLTSTKTGGLVQNVELTKPYLVLYLGDVTGTQTVTFSMKAALAVKAQAPPSDCYPYYTPEYRVMTSMPEVTVSAK